MALRAGSTFWPLVTVLAVGAIWYTTTGRSPADAPLPAMTASPARFFALRLRPGQDLKRELLTVARREGIRAGAVVTCVGSRSTVLLRLANRNETTTRKGHFEVVSLVDTLDEDGGHLHLSVADGQGELFGGHLVEGCEIYTTAEIVVAELTDMEFHREVDPTYGYKELVVFPRKKGP
jgi:predicted DNA-binding protein with PD1-like motif